MRGKSVIAIVVTLASASAVRADLLQLKMHNNYGDGPGGEFLIEPVAGFDFTPASLGQNSNGWFETFCVEKNEYMEFGPTYYAVLNDEAVNGGGGPNPDPLDVRTAYLYEQFITGQLADYNFGTGALRVASANALQDIIWYIEQEQGWNAGWTSATLQYKFYQDAQANAGLDIGNVRVLNLYGDSQLTVQKQDQLVMIPAPGAALLAVAGLGLTGLKRRRRA